MRTLLATMPRGVLVGSVHLPRQDLPEDIAGLDQLAECLRVADGVYAHEFMLFGVDQLGQPGPHEWLAGGPNRWLTVGRNHVFPLVLDRDTQEVAELDADGACEIIRELGAYREVVRGLFGADYLRLSHGLGREWVDLLQRAAAVGR